MITSVATSTDAAAPWTAPRRLLVLAPWLTFALLVVCVLADAPTALRIPLVVWGVTYAAGAPVVGLLDIPAGPPRTLLTIGVSLAISVLVSGTLVLAGHLTETTGAIALLATASVFTAVRAARSAHGLRPSRDLFRSSPVVRDLRRLRARQWAPTAAALACWAAAAVTVEPRDASEIGMLTAFPGVWWAGVAIVSAAFVANVRGRVNVALAVAQVVLLIGFLYVTMTVAQPYSRIPTSYTHVGLVDYIVRDHRIVSSFDARYSWPGSLSLGAMMTQLAGTASSDAFVKWALPFFVSLWAFAVYCVATAFAPREGRWTHPFRRRIPWIAVWVFLSLNWVGQDYWSSQAMNFFLVLVVVVAVANWFPRRPASRFWSFLPSDQSIPLRSTQRAGLFVVIAAIAAAIAASHQLSPFMLTGAVVALWVIDRRDIRLLPVLVGTITVTWVSWGAQAYWVSHLSRITESLGAVDQVVTAGTSARIAGGSTARQVVLGTRLALSALAWVGAAASFLVARRRSKNAVTVAALTIVPFGAVAMQEYGGEVGLRIFLFSLPFVALLIAIALDGLLRRDWRRPLLTAAAATVVVAVSVAAFVVARYGNEQFEQIYAEDVAVVQAFYRVAPKDAFVVGNNSLNPFRMGPYHDYSPAQFEDLADPDNVDLEAALRGAGIDDGYVIVTEAGIRESLLRDGATAGWERKLHAKLLAMGADEVFRDRRAALYRFELDGVGPAPERPPRDRSLASRYVRLLLGAPALQFASFVILFLVVFGCMHVAGLRPRFGAIDLVGWIGAAAVVALTLARFAAFT